MSGKECFEILDKNFSSKKMENIENIKRIYDEIWSYCRKFKRI